MPAPGRPCATRQRFYPLASRDRPPASRDGAENLPPVRRTCVHSGSSPGVAGECVGYPVAVPLTPGERDTMAARLAGLQHPVRLALYTRAEGCDTCADTRDILDEVAGLSPFISVETHDLAAVTAPPGVHHAPAIVVLRDDGGAFVDHGVRLIGAPIEHELTSLADAILAVGKGDAGLSPQGQARLAALDRPVH